MVVHLQRNGMSEGVFDKLLRVCTCPFRPFETEVYREIKWDTELQIDERVAAEQVALNNAEVLPVPVVQDLVMRLDVQTHSTHDQ
jgi:hypothetical protein